MRELRPYQAEAITAIRRSLGTGHKRPVLMLPTGGGKSRIAGEIVRMARAKGNRVMFVVPMLSLIDQTVESFRADGIDDIGVIQANHWMTDPAKPVQVCSMQTLARRDLPVGIGLVIIDECHAAYKFLHEWMALWPTVPFVGLSATPWARGMAKHWDDLIIASTTEQMIAEGYLSKFRVYAPGHPDLSGVKIERGDYREDQLGAAMDKAPLIADIVRTWKELGDNRPTLLFAVNRAHADHCRQQFNEAVIPAGYIDANTEPEERRIIAAQFDRGELKVVCNVGCLTTGIDWDVRCIILARPTRSESLFVQMVGRGLRTADGKDDCILIDHSDTHQTLGFVTDIHYDELDDGRKDKAKKKDEPQPLPKECPKCHFLRAPKVSLCPSCGFKPERTSDVEHIDGTLTEIKPKADKATKQKWFSMLLSHARAMGYSEGWAANKYKQKFDVWPRGLSECSVSPDSEVSGWIKSEQIRWAKRKGKAKENAAAAEAGLAALDRLFAK